MNKKGQSSDSGGTIVGLLIVLALLALAVWLIFFGGLGTISKIFNLAGTTDIGSVIQGCQGSSDSGFFCSTLKSVDLGGTSQYVTCSYLASSAGGSRLSSSIVCDANAKNDLIGNCKKLNKKGIVVNGVTLTNGPDDCSNVPV